MAGKKKTPDGDKPISDEIEKVVDDIADAVVVDEDTDDVPADAAESGSDDAIALTEPSEDAAESAEFDADVQPDEADAAPQELDVAQADTPDPSQSAAPVEVQQTVIRQGGFWSMLLGGVAAAALGFGGARYLDGGWPFGAAETQDPMADISAQLTAQDEVIATLQAEVEALGQGPDLTEIETAQDEISDEVATLSQSVANVADKADEIETRLTEIEKRPMTQGVSDGAIAAYEAEMQALQDSVAAQRAEIENMAAAAAQSEANAEAMAQATLRRAAITRIQTALDTGDSFSDPLADLQTAGVDAPEALARVADTGAPSLADLQESFPDAARAALDVSRGTTDEGAGLGGFLKAQLGVRSLEPREGDDPDAVLSRAEAAMREGRLTDTLAEIDALPEVGRAELTDWMGQATTRIEALSAVETLLQTLNDS